MTNHIANAPLPVTSVVTHASGMDFIRLPGGSAKIGSHVFEKNWVREIEVPEGLLFGRDLVTNIEIDEYVAKMGDRTHALVMENRATRHCHIVARGTEKEKFPPFASENGNPDAEFSLGADVFRCSYVRVVPPAHRLLDLSRGFSLPHYPAIRVSWHEALGYLDYMSRKTGMFWRLPTEEEWEYAALAGSDPGIEKKGANTRATALSDEEVRFVERAHYQGFPPVPAKDFPANPWGIRGMAGGIKQWTNSPYGSKRAHRVILGVNVGFKGDQWRAQNPWDMQVRLGYRGYMTPDQRDYPKHLGFRAVIVPEGYTEVKGVPMDADQWHGGYL